jgi:hypothetical protein
LYAKIQLIFLLKKKKKKTDCLRNPLEIVKDSPKIFATVVKKVGAAPRTFLLVHGVSPNFFGRKISGCPTLVRIQQGITLGLLLCYLFVVAVCMLVSRDSPLNAPR